MKTYHIITIGCQMNKSDSERVAAVLEKQGYRLVHDKYKADLVVINTCGVRQSAEDRVYSLIPKIKKQNRGVKIVLTGCLVGREDVRRRLNKYIDMWLPITQISNFKFLISNKISNVQCQNNYLTIKPKYGSKFSAFVPIGNGCNNFCSYCVVPYARGKEVYRPVEDILGEMKNLIKNRYKEIVLIAQNVNSYQSKSVLINANNKAWDLNRLKQINFANLLKMINDVKGDFRITFATSHPKDMSDELITTIAKCEKVIPYIHLPVQSGDNEILKKMNRNYTAGHYKNLVKKIRVAFKKHRPNSPEVKISTDIIVGFPGETKKQFQNTIKLCKAVKFSKAYIARYSPRPGTVAYKLKDNVSPREKKRRWGTLEKLINKTGLKK